VTTTLSALAAELLQRLEAEVERRGWVERRTGHGDHRAVTLALTPAGERVLAAVERCEREAELDLARRAGVSRHLAARTALRDLLRSAG
jgi:DNA-binding MarR family transcriptional regulator